MINDILEEIISQVQAQTTAPVVSATDPKQPTLSDHYRVTIIPGEPVQVAIGQDRILRNRGTVQIAFVSRQPGEEPDGLVTYFNANRFFTTASGNFRVLFAWRTTPVADTGVVISPTLLRYEFFN